MILFEKRHEPLAPLPIFLKRVACGLGIAALILAAGLGIGVLGYHALPPITWLDAFYNAALILSDMGPVTQILTPPGELFIGFYALFSGLAFVTMMSIIFAPLIHRLMHSFHLGDEEDKTLIK